MEPIWRLSATAALEGLRAGRFTSEMLVSACLDRIREIDHTLRAFITLSTDKALDAARASDARRSAGASPGPLEGLPFAVKDLVDTAGVRTTHGSVVFAGNVPAADDTAVARLRQAGAILIGKTNVPEFGFGPRSTNRLCGPTANPYDHHLSSGGSSGGSAAALGAGMVPLALGTDFGGSVRTPASFCGVIGMRPTPGYIPTTGRALAWNALSTHGVMARTVADAALMLDAISGYDPGDPLSHPLPPTEPAPPPDETLRIAFTEDFEVTPVSFAVRRDFRKAVEQVATLFPRMEAATPDCIGAIPAFATLRAGLLHRQFGELVARHRGTLTESFVWNVERGAGMTADAFLAAEEVRSNVLARFARFFEDHDVLLTPAVSVMPFSNDQEDVLMIDGEALASQIDYLAITFIVSLIGWPCLSIPCHWTPDGIPLGMQIIVPPWQEARLFAVAAMLEARLGFRHRWPEEGARLTSTASDERGLPPAAGAPANPEVPT